MAKGSNTTRSGGANVTRSSRVVQSEQSSMENVSANNIQNAIQNVSLKLTAFSNSVSLPNGLTLNISRKRGDNEVKAEVKGKDGKTLLNNRYYFVKPRYSRNGDYLVGINDSYNTSTFSSKAAAERYIKDDLNLDLEDLYRVP